MADPTVTWGKWRGRDSHHPLICHLIDVACVAARLHSAQPSMVSALLGWQNQLPDAEQLEWTAYLAGLHDLGKASPGFQVHPSLSSTDANVIRQKLADAGLPVPRLQAETPHGVLTAYVLPHILRKRFGLSADAARAFALIAGAHHGRFPTSQELGRITPRSAGDDSWSDFRLVIANELANTLGVSRISERPPDRAAAVALAGFISVADWIGSMEEYFPYAVSTASDTAALDLRAYAAESIHRADRALRELHWLADTGLSAATRFDALFPAFSPNGVQQAAIDAAANLTAPSLVIIEAPMGDGKTEAAMYLAQHFAARLAQNGCYFALPTQATSNQMFSRVRGFLERARIGEVNLQLLHGHAALSAEFQTLREKGAGALPAAVYGEDDHFERDQDMSTVVAGEWFTYRKRGLLAPFGVGTVDQALMAVLQTRHYFVRLFGLAGKTVVIDEVHAYDAYMTTLMERLLEWLASLGSSVVLLSATLPSARREGFTAAYMRGLGANAHSSGHVSYPRLTWASACGQDARAVVASERSRRRIRFEWLDAESISERLASALAGAGCAAVICNTVGRAQEVYRSLKAFFPAVADDGEPELTLFHARYPFEQRDLREKQALVRFGKEGASVEFGEGIVHRVKRPSRAVLVATQVIEQSLDLDFDLMVSDFAPVDLILQRAGRLHRHERTRPDTLDSPRMLMIRPEIRDGVPDFGHSTEAVYDRHILMRSWVAICEREIIGVPDDVENLIEFVYGDKTVCPEGASQALREAWAESESHLHAKRERYETLAKQNRIPAADDESLFEENAALDEDNPEVHKNLQALTRLSEGPEVSVILLRTDETASFDPRRVPSRDQAIALLQHEVRIAHRAVAPALLNDESSRPAGWRRSPLLRHHRLVELDAKGRAQVGNFEILVDPELGIVILQAGGGENGNGDL